MKKKEFRNLYYQHWCLKRRFGQLYPRMKRFIVWSFHSLQIFFAFRTCKLIFFNVYDPFNISLQGYKVNKQMISSQKHVYDFKKNTYTHLTIIQIFTQCRCQFIVSIKVRRHVPRASFLLSLRKKELKLLKIIFALIKTYF